MSHTDPSTTWTPRSAPASTSWVHPLLARTRSDGFLEFLRGVRNGKRPAIDANGFTDLAGVDGASGSGKYIFGASPDDDFVQIVEK